MGRHSQRHSSESRHHRSRNHQSSCHNLTEEQRARRSIVISNLPPSIKRKHIIAGFSVLGHIFSCDYQNNGSSETDASYRVTYDKPVSAVQAVTCLNNHFCRGSQLHVAMIECSDSTTRSTSIESKPYHWIGG